MKNAEKMYNYNADGSVRAEFVTKENGVIPLGYFAKILGVNVVNAFKWNKADFRGFVLDAMYVNDDGLICDEHGNPIEQEDYTLLPGCKVEKWGQHLWIDKEGDSVLNDEEWDKLSADEQKDYRKVDCMKLEPVSGLGIEHPIYVCREAATVLAEVLRLDVMIGDPIIKRYQHECKHNAAFAERYGLAFEAGYKDLERKLREHSFMMEVLDDIFGIASMICCSHCSSSEEDEDSAPAGDEPKEDHEE